jgi:acyl-CoA synthetase (NDP forming)
VLNGLDAVFTPRRVAVVGASERDGTVGRLIWDNLMTFPGDVLPVSRTHSVFGRRAYRAVADLPGEIDLVVVAVPAGGVLEVIGSAGAKRVGAAVILGAGFAETGADGAALQQQVLDVARAGGVRLVGPNCFGVQNCQLPLNASIAAGTPPAAEHGRPGVSLLTQSGAYGMAVHAMGRDESTRFAKIYAAGNKADIADHEVLDYLADDPATGVICLLLESISQPRTFFEVARRATARKPVIATVTGRSAEGRRAALSHTASMASDDRLLDAMLRQAGVVRTRTGLQMLDAARVLVDQPAPAGPRVGIITNSGGTGVELADLLVDEGLTVPELSGPVQDALRELLPEYASPRNPVDMTPVWPRFPELYAELIDRLARSGEVDVVLPILLQRAASDAVVVAVRDAVMSLREVGNTVPVVVCWVAPRAAQQHADLLQAAGVPCLPWPERTAQAVGVAVRCAATAGRSIAHRTAPASVSSDAHPTCPTGVLAQRDLLIRSGIHLARTELCTTADDAVAAADRIGYPAVLKVEHPDLSHKSDVGGVRTSLADAAAVRSAAAELLALAPGATVIVQQQHHGLELVVGAVRDSGLGPVAMVGFGGTALEVDPDARFALAPIDHDDATLLWRSLRKALLLNGIRGASPVDLAGLADLAVAIGDLMLAHPELTEIDLNPVLAGPNGYVAVDWRMT